MSSQKCIWCKKPQPLEHFCVKTSSITKTCEPCLEVDNAHAHANTLDTLADTLASMMTLNEFYSKLEAAKEEETHTHMIPFHSKGAAGGNGVQFVRLTALGNDNMLDLNPELPEGTKAYRALADNISTQCSHILGYLWRYDLHDTCQHCC